MGHDLQKELDEALEQVNRIRDKIAMQVVMDNSKGGDMAGEKIKGINDPKVLVVRDLRTLLDYHFLRCDKRKALAVAYAYAINERGRIKDQQWMDEQIALVPDHRKRLHCMEVVKDPKPDTRQKLPSQQLSLEEIGRIKNPLEKIRAMQELYGSVSTI